MCHVPVPLWVGTPKTGRSGSALSDAGSVLNRRGHTPRSRPHVCVLCSAASIPDKIWETTTWPSRPRNKYARGTAKKSARLREDKAEPRLPAASAMWAHMWAQGRTSRSVATRERSAPTLPGYSRSRNAYTCPLDRGALGPALKHKWESHLNNKTQLLCYI